MSLYHHVRDKDDLLDEVVDRLLVRAWKPRAGPTDWRAWVVEAADRLRRFLVAQPAALHVYLAHPVVSPAAVTRMEAVMAVLRQALGDEQAAQRAYAAIHTYTIGFAALEASRAGWDPARGGREQPSHPGPEASRAGPHRGDLDAGRLAEQLAAYTTPHQFAQGLHYLLDGIVQHGEQPPGSPGQEEAGPNRGKPDGQGRPRPAPRQPATRSRWVG